MLVYRPLQKTLSLVDSGRKMSGPCRNVNGWWRAALDWAWRIYRLRGSKHAPVRYHVR